MARSKLAFPIARSCCYDYGRIDNAPTPEPGVYGVLRSTSSGWELLQAGEPESIDEAGHFTYRFNDKGRLTELSDEAGNVQRFTYDTTGELLKSVVDLSTNRRIDFDHSAKRISRVIEAGGAAVTFLGYTTSGLLSTVEVRGSDNVLLTSRQWEYDSRGAPITITHDYDPRTTKRYTYKYVPAAPFGTERIPVVVTANGFRYEYVHPSNYIGSARVTKVTGPNGGVTRYTFDYATDNLDSVETPPYSDGSTRLFSYAYDAQRNLVQKSPTRQGLQFTYNDLGKVVKVQRPAAWPTYYDWSDLDLVRVRDDGGTLAEYAYTDPRLPHHPTLISDASGATWEYRYNAYGQATEIVPPAPLGKTAIVYDENPSSSSFGYRLSVTDGSGRTTYFRAYSPLGDLLEWSSSPNGTVTNVWKATYDAARRLRSLTYADGKTETFAYTGRHMTESKDPLGMVLKYSYCPGCGGLENVMGPLAHTLSWGRDANDNITSFTDARGKATLYTRALSGDVSKETLPDGRATTIHYDYMGVPYASSIDGTSEYRRDYPYYHGEIYASVREGGALRAVSLSDYNSDLTLKESSVENQRTQVKYEYDAARRLTAEVHQVWGGQWSSPPWSETFSRIEYDYYPDGSRKALRWLHNGVLAASWSYSYDGEGRLTSLTNSFGETTTYTYDGEGKLKEEEFSNTTKVLYTYQEARGWVSKIDYRKGTSVTASYAITRDAGGKITKVVEGPVSKTLTYTYDALNRLTQETGPQGTKTYAYDLAGNITSMTGVGTIGYDAGNKISSIANGSVQYDAVGRTLSASGTGVTSATYSWYASDKLYMQSSGSSKLLHSYDGHGRRRRTDVLSPTGTAERSFIFAGSQLVGEVVNGVPVVAYTWGASGLTSQRDLYAGKSYWYQFGPQAETPALTSSTGSVVATYRYTAYGKHVASSGTVYSPFRYAGRVGCYQEGSAALILCEARWYSPELGRRLTRDPIGYDEGENQYGYVAGDPVTWIDSTGYKPDISLLPEGGKHGKEVEPYKPVPDELSVAGHSNGKYVTNEESTPMGVEELAALIRKHSKWKPGMPIRLLACHAARGPNSFAERLAKELEAIVIAPSRAIVWCCGGQVYIQTDHALDLPWSKWRRFDYTRSPIQ